MLRLALRLPLVAVSPSVMTLAAELARRLDEAAAAGHFADPGSALGRQAGEVALRMLGTCGKAGVGVACGVALGVVLCASWDAVIAVCHTCVHCCTYQHGSCLHC
jgi:hypothetical protein